MLWVKNESIHYLDNNNDEWKYTGENKGETDGTSGSIWIENNKFHYIDKNGIKRECVNNILSNTTGIEGSVWIENNCIHFLTDNGYKAEVNKDWNDHNDTGYSDDAAVGSHRDTEYSYNRTSSYTDHADDHSDNMHEDYIDGAPPTSKYPNKVWAQFMGYDTKYKDHSDSHSDEMDNSRTSFIDRHYNTTRYSHGDNWEDWSDWADQPIKVN